MASQLHSVAKLVDDFGLKQKKQLGQNFLYDLNITEKIINLSIRYATPIKDANILEIGPGPGGLTRVIAEQQPKNLCLIEHDNRAVPILEYYQEYFKNVQFNIINHDALQISLKQLDFKPLKIIANLPYNVGTELLYNWLYEADLVADLTLMFQKEVAERICAEPNSKKYGKLSIMVQTIFTAKKLFILSPKAFNPPPKVDSAVILLINKNNNFSKEYLIKLNKLTSYLFSYRRKQIGKLLQKNYKNALEILAEMQIPVTARPEALTVEQYNELSIKLMSV